MDPDHVRRDAGPTFISEHDVMSEPRILDARTDDEILSTFDVMAELRPHLARDEYVSLVRKQMEAGYRITFVIDERVVQAAAGWRFSQNLAWGRFLYIDDLVTRTKTRSRGHGKRLLDHLYALAKQAGWDAVHLDSGTQRKDAHRFYLRERFDITAFHFVRKTSPP